MFTWSNYGTAKSGEKGELVISFGLQYKYVNVVVVPVVDSKEFVELNVKVGVGDKETYAVESK